MEDPLPRAFARALVTRFQLVFGASTTPQNYPSKPSRSSTQAKPATRSDAGAFPWIHLWRIAAIVLAACVSMGALSAAPVATADAGAIQSQKNFSEAVFNLPCPGQSADPESSLSYNYFRSYSPTTGRYVQPDPIGRDGGWNRFGYVSANPLQYSDPNGLAQYSGLDDIVAHLERLSRAQGDNFWTAPWAAPERAMIARLRTGEETPWDVGFYHHEKAEADMCHPYLNSSPEEYLRKQKEAHDQVERNQQNTQWDRYHPDVIRRFPDLFPTIPK